MTYQQLIKKLRWGWRFVEGQDISNRDLEQAATSIEELVKERDELAAALDENWVTHLEVMQAKMQLAKAIAALRFVKPLLGNSFVEKRALAMLAELEGK